MTAPLTTADAPRTHAPRARHRRARHTAVVAGVALLLAAGGYTAATTFAPTERSPESWPASPDYVTPTDTVTRELRESVTGQYGAPPSPPKYATRQHVQPAGQYVTPTEHVMRHLHESIVGQYGSTR